MCATKRECKWRGKKILRKSVTKTEKSRYRDEFLIRYSKEVYVLNRFFLPKNSSKLSYLFIATVFLIFLTVVFIFLLRKSRIKNSIIYSIILLFFLFLLILSRRTRDIRRVFTKTSIKSLLKWFRSAYIHLQCRLSIRELSRAQMS